MCGVQGNTPACRGVCRRAQHGARCGLCTLWSMRSPAHWGVRAPRWRVHARRRQTSDAHTRSLPSRCFSTSCGGAAVKNKVNHSCTIEAGEATRTLQLPRGMPRSVAACLRRASSRAVVGCCGTRPLPWVPECKSHSCCCRPLPPPRPQYEIMMELASSMPSSSLKLSTTQLMAPGMWPSPKSCAA